jgi:hypothetical protein
MNLIARRFAAVSCLGLLAATAKAAEPAADTTAAATPHVTARQVSPAIDRALDRLYNFDFDGAQAILDSHILKQPEDPLGYVFRAAAYLFSELDRLDILASEFFKDDENLHADERATADPVVREHLMEALDRSRELAQARLAIEPDDEDAMFALCMADGLLTDYLGLIEKRGLKSFSAARAANRHAQRLLELDPEYYDAHLSNGVNEYLVGSLPFFVRWFVRMEGIEGDKGVAMTRLELVAERGAYLGPFARILMSIMSLREDKPGQALELLQGLNHEYPENPLIRHELAKLSAKMAAGELTAN